ncbi:hypothetical protein [Parasphingorhabdus pacifica]
MSWAEEEINQAQQHHPHTADTAPVFYLLRLTSDRVSNESSTAGTAGNLFDRTPGKTPARPARPPS